MAVLPGDGAVFCRFEKLSLKSFPNFDNWMEIPTFADFL